MMGYYDMVQPFIDTWVKEQYGVHAKYNMMRVSAKMYKLVVIKNETVIAESASLKANGPWYWNGEQLAKLILSIK